MKNFKILIIDSYYQWDTFEHSVPLLKKLEKDYPIIYFVTENKFGMDDTILSKKIKYDLNFDSIVSPEDLIFIDTIENIKENQKEFINSHQNILAIIHHPKKNTWLNYAKFNIINLDTKSNLFPWSLIWNHIKNIFKKLNFSNTENPV